MARTGIAFLAAALALSWPGPVRDVSLGTQMAPIALARTGGRVLLVSPMRLRQPPGGKVMMKAVTARSPGQAAREYHDEHRRLAARKRDYQPYPT